jgi:acetyl esterase/lipase
VSKYIIAIVLALFPASAWAQTADGLASAIEVFRRYQITPHITYWKANNWEAKLDIYRRRDMTTPNRTLIYIHGGGWTDGSKEQSSLAFLPYLQMGWNVVNVEYRLARVSLAPAAVEDSLCALRWVHRYAAQYSIDTTRLVITGGSAGSHLALMAGMAPPSAGLDRQCPGPENLKVAAIINWYGITDVVDVMEGPNTKPYGVMWLGSMLNRKEIAKHVSPLTYVRQGIPPVLTIHGDADPTVPYSHAVRLREALEKAGVPNELVTVPGGAHGGFSQQEMVRIYAKIQEFLGRHLPTDSTSR